MLAFAKARRGKGWQRAVQNMERDLNSKLARLGEALSNKTFTTSPYKLKTIHEPKTRTIYRLPFYPDRIVQHALMNVIEPIWDKMFISDSYACRRGRGLHAGSRRTMELVRKYRYCLKCDISKFYPSIDHNILFKIIQRKIKCRDTLWLIENIIYSIPGGKNVPIGNYTSQWFGNLYLNELDRHIKNDLKIRGYVRYCDDFCLFSTDKLQLRDAMASISEFLADRLSLILSKREIFPVSQGVDFLGYRHFPNKILLRKSTAKRVKRRIKQLPQQWRRGLITTEHMRSSLASILGWLTWAQAYNFRRTIGIDELWALCRHEAIQ